MLSSIDSYEARLAAQIAEDELKRKARRDEKERQKAMELAAAQAQSEEGDADMDPEMAALMGFGGFGSSKK